MRSIHLDGSHGASQPARRLRNRNAAQAVQSSALSGGAGGGAAANVARPARQPQGQSAISHRPYARHARRERAAGGGALEAPRHRPRLELSRALPRAPPSGPVPALVCAPLRLPCERQPSSNPRRGRRVPPVRLLARPHTAALRLHRTTQDFRRSQWKLPIAI